MAQPDMARIEETLAAFIALVTPTAGTLNPQPRGGTPAVLAELEVIETILNRFTPGWRSTCSQSTRYRFAQHREAAIRCLARIQRQEELASLLGDDPGPTLRASTLHPWVWDAARPQWESGHFGEAVHAAARLVNSRLQQRLSRQDVSDAKLVREAFSLEPAAAQRPRLRVAPPDGSEKYKSLQVGVMDYGAGCFQAIRNRASHDPETASMEEQFALERLAAFSLLARWIEDADLEVLDGAG